MTGKQTIAGMVKRHIAEWEIILDDSKREMLRIQKDLAKISVRLNNVRRNLPYTPEASEETEKKEKLLLV